MSFTNILQSKPMGVFLAIIFVLVMLMLLAVVASIETLLDNMGKKKKQEIDDRNHQITNPLPTESMTARIDGTNQFLELIVTMIETEIGAVTFKNVVLGQPYELTKIDADIKLISENVYRGIRPEFLNDPNNILTPEYLMGAITKYTSTMMINKCSEINRAIRNNKIDQ